MRTRASLPAIVLLAVALAGCAAPVEPVPTARGTSPPPAPEDAASPAQGAAGAWAWAEPGSARVRPGVQVVGGDGAQCTSNFVFVDARGQAYLGLAAHCVEGMELGDEADVGPGAAKARLAYSSFLAMGKQRASSPTAAEACEDEPDAAACGNNDFALLLLEDSGGAVSPAMLRYGGPTGLADSSAVGPRDKVLTFGNSSLRQRQEAVSAREGYVLERSAWEVVVQTAVPGVFGDSGSGVLLGDGQALGVLVTLQLGVGVPPKAGSNGVVPLDLALAYAREKAGLDVSLATWELLDPGLLPDLP